MSSRISSSSKRWQYIEQGQSFWPSEVRSTSAATFKIPAGGATLVCSSRQGSLKGLKWNLLKFKTSKRDQWCWTERLKNRAPLLLRTYLYFYSLLLWNSTQLHFGRRYFTLTELHLYNIWSYFAAHMMHLRPKWFIFNPFFLKPSDNQRDIEYWPENWSG